MKKQININSTIIRNKPRLEVILNEIDFEIINDQNENQNGVYLYELTDYVVVEKKKINWLITTLSYIVELVLSDVGGGDTYHAKNKLKFNYNKSEVKILLVDCDIKTVESLTKKLNLKLALNSHSTT